MFGVCRKLARTLLNSSSAVNGRPLDFCFTHTPSFSKLFIPPTNGLVCRLVLCVLCTKCTLHCNHRLALVIFQHTKRLLSPAHKTTSLPVAAIFSLHTLASPSGRNVNYDEIQLTGGGGGDLSCSLYLYRFCKYERRLINNA
jgi:hypothetical protein